MFCSLQEARVPEPKQASPPLAYPRAQRALAAWNAAVYLAWLAGPFLAAGDPLWVRGWAHLGLLALCLVGHQAWARRRNPELIRRRRRIGPGTKTWDLWWNALLWPLLAATCIVAGLDARRGAALPGWSWPAGAALLIAAMSLSAAAFGANPFFEGTVRIQKEVGQYPVDAGPYRWIRHPGYLGLALWPLALPLLLGSPRAFAPAAAAAAWVVLRTALEDSVLQRELPGYREYAARVRRRLLPRVW
jgi:protein-S-isoprenylcysteine O-methyltransferase Ste14